jgi:hypothetical protein
MHNAGNRYDLHSVTKFWRTYILSSQNSLASNVGPIFISYRSTDNVATGNNPAIVNRLKQDLTSAFPEHQIFFAPVDISGSLPFDNVIREQLRVCSCLIAIVGDHWLGQSKVTSGLSRLHDEDDWVRIEVETVLSSGKPIQPVFVGGIETFPDKSLLPVELQTLFPRNGVKLQSYGIGFPNLVKSVQAILFKYELIQTCFGPLQQNDDFTGRKAELNQVATLLGSGKSVQLWGLRTLSRSPIRCTIIG